jgi:Domain of unknown function (DUF4440)
VNLQGEEYSSAETIEELTNQNEFILQAEEQGHKADLAPLLTDEFIIIRATGVKQNRDDFLKAVPGNAGRGRTADQPEVHLYGDCAVFTCRVTTTRNPDGTPGGGSFWNTRLFVRDPEGWRCAAWQVTKIPES